MSSILKEMAVRLLPLNGKNCGCKWEHSLDTILCPGSYTVEIEHAGNDVGLPVDDCGEKHYIVGNLVVTDSGTAGPKQRNRLIGQLLSFTDCIDKSTKIYARTYSGGVWNEWVCLSDSAQSNDTSLDALTARVETLEAGGATVEEGNLIIG